jgi:hypothetical protein
MNIEIAPKETEIQANWNDAKLYCFALNIDGKTGWRLPTKEELTEIYQSENDFEKWYYFSSTETEEDSKSVYVMHFFSGRGGCLTNTLGTDYVRAVRDL